MPEFHRVTAAGGQLVRDVQELYPPVPDQCLRAVLVTGHDSLGDVAPRQLPVRQHEVITRVLGHCPRRAKIAAWRQQLHTERRVAVRWLQHYRAAAEARDIRGTAYLPPLRLPDPSRGGRLAHEQLVGEHSRRARRRAGQSEPVGDGRRSRDAVFQPGEDGADPRPGPGAERDDRVDAVQVLVITRWQYFTQARYFLLLSMNAAFGDDIRILHHEDAVWRQEPVQVGQQRPAESDHDNARTIHSFQGSGRDQA